MYVLLALASAACYGAADFVGGIVSRRAHTMVVVLVSQAAGLVMTALLLLWLPPSSPQSSDWVWGAAAGLTGGIGVALLYRALAIGVMAVIAPTTAVCAVVVPVVLAVSLGERPGAQALVGIALAIAAIVLVSQARSENQEAGAADPRSGVGLALASGLMIGLFFFSLARANPDAGLWPLLSARLVSVGFFAISTLFYRPPFRMSPAIAATTVGGGLLDMFANLLYLLATHTGPLTMVVTLSSLYPASTVMLARTVLGERLTVRQWTGVVCALIAIVTIVGAAK
jgi:uncharacterized membrane protein